MKRIKFGFSMMASAVLASCSTVPAYCQEYVASAAAAAMMEMPADQVGSVTYELDLVPVIGIALIGFVAYKLIKRFRKPHNGNVAGRIITTGDICGGKHTGGGSSIVVNDNGALISIQGNSNCYVNGVTVNGVRVPDIEVKDKVLYLDGVKKRHLGNNCRIYNRGAAVFVDGKHVA